jgi:hypothetical protein
MESGLKITKIAAIRFTRSCQIFPEQYHLFMKINLSGAFRFLAQQLKYSLQQPDSTSLNPETPDRSFRKEDIYMKMKCTLLTVAVLAISFSLGAQARPGANPTTPAQGNNTPSTQNATQPQTQSQIINSELFIARADSSLFSLLLDGVTVGSPAKSFNLTNLTPGYHRVQMTKPAVGRPINGRAVTPEVLYDGYVNIPEASRVTAVNSGREQLNIVSIVPLIQYILGILGQGGQTNPNGGQTNNPWGSPWGWPIGPQAMAPQDFEMLRATVMNKGFESSKMDVIRMAMMNNYFSSAQVAQLMNMMSFESTKLDLAKMMYARVVDKGNFYLVNNAFGFSSSSNELAQFITGFGG